MKKVLENIFSKSVKEKQKETSNPKIQIIIDTREKQSMIASILVQKKANIKFEHLHIADYLIGNIAIERKTISDFISSMINKRLFNQLNEIKKYPSYFLIIEGNRDSLNENFENPCRGMILSVITDFQVPIIFTANQEDTATFLILLAKRIEKSKQELSMRHMKKPNSLNEQKQFILEGFKNIGPKTSKKLLKEFKSIKNIINAPIEKLQEVIGRKAEGFRIVD